jgi:NADH dehydrogenase [ubiquinone] 1 alpha subcomplex assembly factor 7
MGVAQEIIKIIEKKSYIALDQFMSIALSSTKNSYYANTDCIGVGKDFITAPEISQLFGEMIALWCVDKWLKAFDKKGGSKFNLVELGAGRGTLMRDILRTTKKIAPLFFSAIQKVLIVEINKSFRKLQHDNLSCFGICIEYVNSTNLIEDFPSIIIANEFFDALPIRQYQKTNIQTWQEVVIKNNQQLYFSTKGPDIRLPDYRYAQIGAIVEVSPSAIFSMQDCCRLLSNCSGAMLVIDYGYDLDPSRRHSSQYTSTLQGIKDHKYHNIFNNLGDADITTHVDFYALKKVCDQNNLQDVSLCTQKDFLKSQGIDLRLERLITINPSNAKVLISQYNYLLQDMGILFKTLSINNF